MSDRVTIQLVNPRGWIYVNQFEDGRWGWEARLGGFGLDAGIAHSEEEGLAKARAAVKKELGYYAIEKETNMGIEGIEDLAGHQDDATELPDGEAERQSQEEEKQADHEERQDRLNEETSVEETSEPSADESDTEE